MLRKMKQTNCFAEKENGKCKILLKKDCSNCNFYKTKEKFEYDGAKVLQRINALDEVSRVYILKKYSKKGA